MFDNIDTKLGEIKSELSSQNENERKRDAQAAKTPKASNINKNTACKVGRLAGKYGGFRFHIVDNIHKNY